MTSRPSVSNIQHQSQRSLSSMVQRPPSHRAPSQQYHPSPSTKKNENYVDFALDGSETVPGRYVGSDSSVTTPSRINGSRLKLEISNDSQDTAQYNNDSPKALEGPSESQLPQFARGRPRIQFQDPSQVQGVHDAPLLSSIGGGENITAQTPLPMPRRPGQATGHPPRERASLASVLKKDARPKPYILEVPSAAPRYPPNGFADFFPWTGDHPEDSFTDHVIRQGYFDKTQTTQNETNSAKQSIFPSLKHKSGLQTLSSLFTNVLFQRRTHGQITAPPTFKPPPRVTLTDTKRETWLRDLANPSISLRRLSRTIPHGIRGKVLLEQCLSKNIPTERAVWLAKCVGANEIRAFKRKGVTGTFAMGGEAKWIRDWTAFVEQFVESVVASCGDKDWKPRVFYAVRLAAHLYSEHLLDRDHYMDWLSTILETCLLAKAPIWLLITQVYWKDLLKYRKHGRRLVAALCAHLHAAHGSPDGDLLLPLIDRMTGLLNGLMGSYSESFISPKMWSKYKGTLEFYLSTTTNFDSIDQRNGRLSPHGVKDDQSPRRLLIQLLDKSISQPFSNDLANDCWNVTIDRSMLIRTILEWSSSAHRPGLTKIYLATRLFKTWSASGVDIDDEILSFLESGINNPSFYKPSFYHLVSELARSGHFSVSRYLQWLIARGAVREPLDFMEDGPCATRLLAELPTNDLSEGLNRLRRTMLRRASFPIEQELQQIRDQIAVVGISLHNLTACTKPNLGLVDVSASSNATSDRPKLSRAIKSEICEWIRRHVNLHSIKRGSAQMDDWRGDSVSEVKSAITSSEFTLVRRFLEDMEDISVLADVLKAVANSDDIQVLASAVDTLSFHIEVFAAIGTLKDLFDKFLARLPAFREREDIDCTPLLMSLTNLATRLPGAEAVAFQLSQALAQNSRKSAADVCSPISDHMAEALQSSESEFSDEIEKVLASGTSMDQSTLERLFEMIVLQMEASWNKTAAQQRSCTLLLGQLRNFNSRQFDALMMSWLRKILQSSKRPTISYVLGPLVALGCLGFKEVLTSTIAILDSNIATSNPSTASDIATETLELLVGSSHEPNNMLPDDLYRLDIKRLQAQKDFHIDSISIVRRAIELNISPTGNQQGAQAALYRYERMRDFLQYAVLVDIDAVGQGLIMPLAKSPCPEVYDRLSTLIDCLLNHTSYAMPSSKFYDRSLAYRIENALRLADDLSLPFCQLELQFIFAADVPDYSNEEKYGTECLEAFERAVDSAVTSNNRAWMCIIPTLSVQIARHICQRAERLFLQLVPSTKSEDYSALGVAENDDLPRRLLLIINATGYSITSRTLQLASQVVEKLNDLWQIASRGEPYQSIVVKWLPLMLEFIILHINMFDSTKSGSDLRSRMLLSLSTLLGLHAHSAVNNALTQRTFDVALLLVDDLPEDARTNCVRSLKDKSSDAAVRYIFGYSALPMDWLQLSQNGKLVLYPLRRWEVLSEPTPNIGENDTSLSLTLFKARKL